VDTNVTACVHHWVLETPRGPEVRGTCRHCGATRVYPTHGPNDWVGICLKEDCNRPTVAHGLCKHHYQWMRRTGQ
jgi:hypothetical protein